MGRRKRDRKSLASAAASANADNGREPPCLGPQRLDRIVRHTSSWRYNDATSRGSSTRRGNASPYDQLAPLGEDTDLAFLLVEVDANMIHGSLLLSAALTACMLL
jgi:hypothetical protein